MKKIIEIFLSILVLIYASPYSMANSDYEELDSIIAIVENDVITNKELQKALSELKKNPRNKNKEVNQTKLRRLALDQLIERKIIIQYAEAQSINIESALIENALKNIASNNKVSVEDLKKKRSQRRFT
jgi:peptidyl-prolyl cis-trans isomerase SurA